MDKQKENRFQFGRWYISALVLGFFYAPLVLIATLLNLTSFMPLPKTDDTQALLAALTFRSTIIWSLPAILYSGLYLFSSIHWRKYAKEPKIAKFALAFLAQIILLFVGGIAFMTLFALSGVNLNFA